MPQDNTLTLIDKVDDLAEVCGDTDKKFIRAFELLNNKFADVSGAKLYPIASAVINDIVMYNNTYLNKTLDTGVNGTFTFKLLASNNGETPVYTFTKHNLVIPSNVDYEVEGVFDNLPDDFSFYDAGVDGMIVSLETNNSTTEKPDVLYTMVGYSFIFESDYGLWDYIIYQLDPDWEGHGGSSTDAKVTSTNPFWNSIYVIGEEFDNGGSSDLDAYEDVDVEYYFNYKTSPSDLDGGQLIVRDDAKLWLKILRDADGNRHLILNYFTPDD